MKGLVMKWVYSYLLLLMSLGWGLVTILLVMQALREKLNGDIIAAAGASSVMGGLMALNALVVQHWFRKALPQDTTLTPPPPTKT